MENNFCCWRLVGGLVIFKGGLFYFYDFYNFFAFQRLAGLADAELRCFAAWVMTNYICQIYDQLWECYISQNKTIINTITFKCGSNLRLAFVIVLMTVLERMNECFYQCIGNKYRLEMREKIYATLTSKQ